MYLLKKRPVERICRCGVEQASKAALYGQRMQTDFDPEQSFSAQHGAARMGGEPFVCFTATTAPGGRADISRPGIKCQEQKLAIGIATPFASSI